MAPHSVRPTRVGVRRLRDHLSEYLRLVKDGTEVVVTERGNPVARLVPHDRADPLERLIAEGLVRPPLRPKNEALPRKRVVPEGEVSPLVAEQRR